MPIPNEIPRADQDAPASIDTQYCFVPNADGSYGRSNSTFKGALTQAYGDREDWVKIALKAGVTYTFTLTGDGSADPLKDPVLALYDSKGTLVDMNDDVGPNLFGLDPRSSTVTITPEVDGAFYVSVNAYRGNPNRPDFGGYEIHVRELPKNNEVNGNADDNKLHGTDGARPDVINGGAGHDSLYAGAGDDELNGGKGNDLLVGGPGADKLVGGEDDNGDDRDTISYKDSMEGVTINLLTGSARGGDAEGDTFGTDIEDVQGSMLADRLSGDNRKNMMWGLGGDDWLYGDNGDDTLDGGEGDDELNGGDGEDTLKGGPGADKLTGGEGDDTATYAGSSAGVTVRLHSFQTMGGDAEGDTFEGTVTYPYTEMNEDGEPVDKEATLPDIIDLTGSSHADILAGDHRDNTIRGGRGDDRLYGGPGGDETNIDHLYGEHGHDILFGGIGDDHLFGGPGNDHLWGNGGTDTLTGGTGSDWFYITFEKGDSGAGADTVRGDQPGETSNDPAMSNPGDTDTISYEKWMDEDEHMGVTLDLSDTSDNIEGIENIIGSPDDDTLTGDGEDNIIEGGDGDDVLTGGEGSDTVSYRSSSRGVKIDLSDTVPADRGSRGDAAGDVINDGFENIIGSANDDDLRGDASAEYGNTIEGLAGADFLDGGDADTSGAQTLGDLNGVIGVGENGTDIRDTLSYRSSSAGVTVNLATASTSGGDAEGDEIEVFDVDYDHDDDGSTDTVEAEFSTFENLIGSAHRDVLTGDDRENHIQGGAGDDVIRGGKSDDTLEGGPGADMIDGGHTRTSAEDPSDMFTDTASYANARAGVTVDLDAGKGTGGDAEGDTFVSIEEFMGSMNDDKFIASDEADVVNGGGHGADDMVGGEPDWDGSDGDTISYEKSEEAVTVNLGTPGGQDGAQESGATATDPNPEGSYARGDMLTGIENVMGSDQGDSLTGDDNKNELYGGLGNDELIAIANSAEDIMGGDVLSGGAGNDTLIGSADPETLKGDEGHDSITGGGGDDEITGGAGDDVMTGGDGSDTFVFSPAEGDGDDVITDLATEDKIDLSAFNLTPAEQAQLMRNITQRGEDVRIDLSDFGGGTILLQGDIALAQLDANGTLEDGVIGALDMDIFML